MLFSSIPFLFYFLPAVLLVYFAVPFSLKNSVLLLFSLLFYAWGEPKYVLLMLISITIGYVGGLFIKRFEGTKGAKISLIITLVLLLGLLGYFKYADFFIANVNAVTGLSIPLLRIALPIGISFYTFQILSYNVDVYRKNVDVQKNILTFATYVALFPQLIAGPIVRYKDVEQELTKRSITLEKIAYGIRRFIIGLAKKVLIANILGEFCQIFRASTDTSVLFYWLYAIAFTLHIYFDFSGYSDMAIGLGRIFGFHFMENFNYPYISKSVSEFWRRWHMSLGSWFRDYVYIPLGGNRVKPLRLLFNIFVVWILTGFWHGSSWNFILWGLMYALLLIMEKLHIKKPEKGTEKKPLSGKVISLNILKHIYTLFFVVMGFVIFNADDLPMIISDFKALFGFGSLPLISTQTIYYLKSYGMTFIFGLIGCTPLLSMLTNRLKSTRAGSVVITIAEPILLIVLFLLITAFLVDGSYNPFLYFRF